LTKVFAKTPPQFIDQLYHYLDKKAIKKTRPERQVFNYSK